EAGAMEYVGVWRSIVVNSIAILAIPGASAGSVAFRSGGRLFVTVIAKATFSFANDAEMARDAPQEMINAEVHHGNHPAWSIRFASDRAPYLTRAEVLFTGSGYAPPGAIVTTLPVRIGLFQGDQAIFDKSILLRDPAGFQRMPIVYERAFGGME